MACTLSLLAVGEATDLLAFLGRLQYRLHSCMGYPGRVKKRVTYIARTVVRDNHVHQRYKEVLYVFAISVCEERVEWI